MSVFDVIVFTVFIALIVRGVWTGMIAQIVSAGSYFVCWLAASRFAFLIAPSIPAEEPWNQVGAMAVLFIAAMVAVRFFRTVLETFVKKLHLDGLNKLLGGGLGGIKAALICMVLTFFAVTLSETSRNVVFQSKTGHYLADLITKTSAFVPKDSCELLREQLDKFNAQTANAATVRSAADADERLVPSTANSLLSAMANWWSGTKKETAESIKENIAQEITKSLPVPVKNMFQSVSDFVKPNVLEPLKPVIDDLFTVRPAADTSAASLPLPAPEAIHAVSGTAAPRITAEQILDNTAAPVPSSTGAVRYRRTNN